MTAIREVHASISCLLNRIAEHFEGDPKLTLVIRHPDLEAAGKDADFVITNDTLEGAIAALQRRDPRHSAGDGAPSFLTRWGGASPVSDDAA